MKIDEIAQKFQNLNLAPVGFASLGHVAKPRKEAPGSWNLQAEQLAQPFLTSCGFAKSRHQFKECHRLMEHFHGFFCSTETRLPTH